MANTGTNASFSYLNDYVIFQTDKTNDWGFQFKEAAYWIKGALPLPLYVIGTFGNVISLVVLSRVTSDFRSADLCFMVMAVCDLLIINIVLVEAFIYGVFEISFAHVNDTCCKVYTWISYVIRGMSCWMPVLLTVERAVAVLWPHRVGVMLTYRRTKLIILTMTAFFALFNSHYVYGYKLQPFLFILKSFRDMYFMCAAYSQSYVSFRNNWISVESTIYFYLPLTLVAVGNVVLAKTVVTSARSAVSSLLTGMSQTERKRKLQSLSLVRNVLVVSAAFFCFLFPEAVYCAAYPYLDKKIIEDNNYEYLHELLFTVVQMTFFFHSVLNPYFYILAGRKYRERCMKLFALDTSIE